MQLGFFTMPIHPPGRPLAETLEEDRELVLLADRLGFTEGYIGEHLTDAAENITSPLIFIAWLLLPWPYAVLAAALLARAVALPVVQQARPAARLRPIHIGIVEILASVALVSLAFAVGF